MPDGRFPPVVNSLEASAPIVESGPVEASQAAVSMPLARTVSAVVAGWGDAHSAVAVSTVAVAVSMAAVAEASMEAAVAGVSTAVAGEDFMAAADTANS